MGKHLLSAFFMYNRNKTESFQFKFLHRRIVTNNFLYKIRLKEVDSCSFCGDFTDTLIHLFWKCKYTQTFWKSASQWISQNLTPTKVFSSSPALCLGFIDSISNPLLHYFLLIARHHVYTCRLRNALPKLQVYRQLI